MLGYFHIGESRRCYLGTGNIDFDRVFRGLVKAGYEDPITFESFSSAVVNEQLSGILGVWCNLWEDSAKLDRHAKSLHRKRDEIRPGGAGALVRVASDFKSHTPTLAPALPP